MVTVPTLRLFSRPHPCSSVTWILHFLEEDTCYPTKPLAAIASTANSASRCRSSPTPTYFYDLSIPNIVATPPPKPRLHPSAWRRGALRRAAESHGTLGRGNLLSGRQRSQHELREERNRDRNTAALLHVLPLTPEVLAVWEGIVEALGVTGKQTHDAHLVGVMRVHLVTIILSFSTSHFKRFLEFPRLTTSGSTTITSADAPHPPPCAIL
jgi:hypothetical protein